MSLDEGLVSSACRLSSQAGWNQTEEDWRRLIRLPGSCVKVWTDEQEVRVSYSIVSYGSQVAWIGMLLVDEAYRGRGLGKAGFSAALRDVADFPLVGLDATDLGEPIYLRKGFQTICPIVRWTGVPHALMPRDPSPHFGLNEGIFPLDARCSGFDRSMLLKDLEASGAVVLSIQGGSGTAAFGILRAGRTAAHLGPVVASSPESFRSILNAAAELCEGKPMVCDALSSKAGKILADFGLHPARFLKRMTLPALPGCLAGDGVWCGAGFELG